MRVWRSSVSEGYYKQPAPNVFEAQAVQPTDIAEVEAVAILDEVLGLAKPQYVLRGACRGQEPAGQEGAP